MASWVIFHNFMLKQNNSAGVDFDTDTIKIMLVDDTRVPAQSSDADMETIDDNEVSGTNYTAGGAAVGTKTVALSGGVVTFDGDDVTWAKDAAGFTDARYAVLYKSTGDPATDIPIAYGDLSTDRNNVGDDLTIQMDGDGILVCSEV